MKLEILNCRECGLTFGVDEKAIEDDELVTCPKCDAEVDVEEDEAIVPLTQADRGSIKVPCSTPMTTAVHLGGCRHEASQILSEVRASI